MSATSTNSLDHRLGTPFFLLVLCMFALVVSLVGLYRTSVLTNTRFVELNQSWQSLMENGVEGSEILQTDSLMQGVIRPVPAVQSAAGWSLGMAALSLAFLAWLVLAERASKRKLSLVTDQQVQNDHAAISRLLDEMAPLASGDLSVRASATEGTPGALADAFNYAVGELRRLANLQLASSRTLSDSVSSSHELEAVVERRCATQSGYVHQSSNDLSAMSNSAGMLSVRAVEVSDSSQIVADQAEAGSKTILASLEQMGSMRSDMGKSIKLIRSLSNHNVSVRENIALVEDVAQRTELLALNTNIRASSEGRLSASNSSFSDIGHISDELASLVDELASATGEIGSLAQAMSADAMQALSTMEGVDSTFATCFGEAHTLASTMDEVCSNSVITQSHAAQMAELTVAHAGAVKDLSENMNLINQIAAQTVADIKNNGECVAGLKRVASELRQSVADFQLPEYVSPEAEYKKTVSAALQAAERAAING